MKKSLKEMRKVVNAYVEKLEELATKNDYEKWANYFDGKVMDIKFIMNKHGILEDVIIYFSIGGPAYYIDTEELEIVGHWGSDRYCRELNEYTASKIVEYFEGYFESVIDYRSRRSVA